MRSNSLTAMLVVLVAMTAPTPCAIAADTDAAPPRQPDKGPGGADYKHEKVAHSKHGKGVHEYHLYEPAEPKPKTAPVIVFNHGYAAVKPMAYSAWIEHLVKRGHIVIYPRYQAGLYTSRKELTPNAITAVKAALKELQNGERVTPDLEKFAIVGHSAGGIISAAMAASAKEEGLPAPKAIMCIQPGISPWFPLGDLKQIPKDALLLTLAGDSDHITGRADAERIIKLTTQIPARNKNFILLRSDTHGKPNLRAGHLAPIAVSPADAAALKALKFQLRNLLKRVNEDNVDNERDLDDPLMTDALDYYGCWKLFDGLCDAAFHNRHREYALGDTPQQRFMGKWSDGKAVRELEVVEVK